MLCPEELVKNQTAASATQSLKECHLWWYATGAAALAQAASIQRYL